LLKNSYFFGRDFYNILHISLKKYKINLKIGTKSIVNISTFHFNPYLKKIFTRTKMKSWYIYRDKNIFNLNIYRSYQTLKWKNTAMCFISTQVFNFLNAFGHCLGLKIESIPSSSIQKISRKRQFPIWQAWKMTKLLELACHNSKQGDHINYK